MLAHLLPLLAGAALALQGTRRPHRNGASGHRASSSARPHPVADICALMDLDTSACHRVHFYLDSQLLSLVEAPQDTPVKALEHEINDFLHPGQEYHHGCLVLRVARGLSQDECHAAPVDNASDLGSLSWGAPFADPFSYASDLGASICSAGLQLPASVALAPKFLVYFGDNIYKGGLQNPTIVKARPANSRFRGPGNHVLLNMHQRRFWPAIDQARQVDVNYAQKEDRLVWRGVNSGAPCWHPPGTVREPVRRPFPLGSRLLLMDQYANTTDPRIDVGFSRAKSNPCQEWARPFVKGSLDIGTQLRSKFLLIVEGDDIASAAHWVLASNSVPFMARPVAESWLMESRLVPGKHYIHLESDFSDLVEKLDWAIDNPIHAEEIAVASSEYMREFEDKDREQRINDAVLLTYNDRVKVRGTAAVSRGKPKMKSSAGEGAFDTRCEYQAPI